MAPDSLEYTVGQIHADVQNLKGDVGEIKKNQIAHEQRHDREKPLLTAEGSKRFFAILAVIVSIAAAISSIAASWLAP